MPRKTTQQPRGRRPRGRPRIFISHSHPDKKRFVQRLATDLRGAGARVFYDEWSLKPGDRLRDRISEEIRSCDYFIVVLSVRSIRSPWVMRELDEAMVLEIQGYGPCVIPVLIGRLDEADVPTDLLGLLWVDFRPGGEKRYDTGLFALLEAVGVITKKSFPLATRRDLLTGDEIRRVLRWFAERAQAGTLDEAEFWAFWNEKRTKANALGLLEAAAGLIRDGTDDCRHFICQAVHAAISKHEITQATCPRALLSLLSASSLADIWHAEILQIVLALHAPLPKTIILSYLDVAQREKLHATCQYIEFSDIVVDAEITERLLKVVEDEDDRSFRFVAHDTDGVEVEVDARHQAARCLMLSDVGVEERKRIATRVKARFPDVVARGFDVVLESIVHSERRSTPVPFLDE